MLIAGLGGTSVLPANNKKTFSPEQLLSVESIPLKKKTAIQPVIEASAALLMDVDSGIILYKKNPHLRLPMASLTKVMTALLILENHDLNEVVTIQKDYSQIEELGVRIWLIQYEKMTIENLLIGLLIPSGGDAAMALAEYHSGSVEKFVEEMNQRAKILNLKDTHFTNPIGLDDVGNHYSSVFDLAILTKQALKDKNFARIVQIPRATITSTNGEIKHSFEGTNYLLDSYLDIRGVKTGTTDDAGESLINLAYHWNGKKVIAVLLNSPERFQENKRLINWGFSNHFW